MLNSAVRTADQNPNRITNFLSIVATNATPLWLTLKGPFRVLILPVADSSYAMYAIFFASFLSTLPNLAPFESNPRSPYFNK